MSDTATKTLPQWSTFGTMSTAKVTYRGREITLTQAQEDAAQAMAAGKFVTMARKSGKNIVRQRVLDILAEGKASAPAATATKSKSQTVSVLLRAGADVTVLGVFSSKVSAKEAAEENFAELAAYQGVSFDDNFETLATRWVNDKANAVTSDITVGTQTVAYEIVGKTLRK